MYPVASARNTEDIADAVKRAYLKIGYRMRFLETATHLSRRRHPVLGFADTVPGKLLLPSS